MKLCITESGLGDIVCSVLRFTTTLLMKETYSPKCPRITKAIIPTVAVMAVSSQSSPINVQV